MAKRPQTFNVTLNAVNLDAEAERARGLRAKELLEGASWAIDEYVSNAARVWLSEPNSVERERLHMRVTVAREFKADLLTIVDRYIAAEKDHERRKPRQPADHA